MLNKQIFFTDVHKAELLKCEICDDISFPIGTVFDWRNM